MSYSTENYLDITDHFSSSIKLKIKNNCFNDFLQKLCFHINKNNVILDYRYFNFIAVPDNYIILIQHIISVIQPVLNKNNTFYFHINMDSLSLLHIDKYFTFIKQLIEILKETFPDKLEICYIYNAPYIFSQLFNTIGTIIDKKIRQKIKIVKCNKD